MKFAAVAAICGFTVCVFPGGQIPASTATLQAPKTAKAGAVLRATVVLSIPEGNHVIVPPGKKDQIPVAVLPQDGAKYKLLRVDYPKGLTKRYPGFGDELMNTYEGKVRIPVAVQLPKGGKGKYTLALKVRAQVCSNTQAQCYRPQTDVVSATIIIKQGNSKP